MNHLQPKKRPTNPEQETNWVCNLFFFYTRKICWKGFKTDLVEDDIYEALPSYKSKNLGDKIDKIWEKEKSMPALLWKCFGKQYTLIVLTFIISIATTYLQPKLLKKFVAFFTPGHANLTKTHASLYGISLIFVVLVRYVYVDNFHLRLVTFAFKVRASFMSLIYRRVLKFKTNHVGQAINFMTRDVNEFQDAIVFITYLWTNFLRFLVTCYLLYTEIGWLFNILVGIVVISLAINVYLAHLVGSLKLKSLQKSDRRYQITKEVLSGIKVVKASLWAETFKTKISKIRKDETQLIHRIYFLLFAKFALSEAFLNAAWYSMVVSSIWFGVETNAGTLFLIMSSVQAVSAPLKYFFPNGLHELVTITTVLKRIGLFLRQSDDLSEATEPEDGAPNITLSNLDIYVSDYRLLENINLLIGKGVTAVTGPTGSGKSLLLNTLTLEHQQIKGNFKVAGRISHASQEPWLFPSTIKQNILFGTSYNQKRYFEVLRVCGLLNDLDGESIVADRGANLSRGQQARVNLARAVYKDCDIYLLDDSLAQLDVVLADFIFKECIRKFLADKVVLLVTKNEKYTEWADGTIEIDTDGHVHFSENENRTSILEEERGGEFFDLPQLHQETKIYREEKKSGKVLIGTYRKFFQFTGGFVLFAFVAGLGIVAQVGKSSINKMESYWINTEQNMVNLITKNSTGGEKYEETIGVRHKMYYMFPIILAAVTALVFIKSKIYCLLGKKASASIHKVLLSKVINASADFFDNVLLGNILNRFSEDLLFVDERLTYLLFYVMEYCFIITGVVVVIATVNAAFLIPTLLLCVIVVVTRSFYIRTGRALKRLELSVRSPFIGHINATMEGLPTIRISKMERTVCEEFDRCQDLYTSTSYVYMCCFTAFEFLIHIYGVIFIAFVIIRYLIFDSGVSPGDVGLVFSQSIMILEAQLQLFRLSCRFESEMAAVERIIEYTELKQEHRGGFVVENWPSCGEVEYENVSFSYKKGGNCVVRNASFSIQPKEKIAIIGKSASGKTSLVSLLLRFYPFEGKISIDGVDITTLPLEFLRSKICLVPQDPFIFCGTIRQNIDPAGKHTDEEIWEVIVKLHLKNVFSSLGYEIDNTRSDLSVGQKQLICLGRALLRNEKIVILDEITSSVDSETERAIYKIINENFAESTVIIITHNVQFAVQFDRVGVMDKGAVVQYGAPSDLVEDGNGVFTQLFKH